MTETYRYVRENRRDLYDAVVSVGLSVACYNDYHDPVEDKTSHNAKQRLGAIAESRAMEIVATILKEQRP